MMEINARDIENISNAKICVIGDIILDNFVYGSVDRISPEAPIPVLNQTKSNYVLGGAGNVVANMSSLGANVKFISVIGDDEAGAKIRNIIDVEENISTIFITDKAKLTPVKTRYIAGTQHLLRVDEEVKGFISQQSETVILKNLTEILNHYQIIVLSDYQKGTISDNLACKIISIANEKGVKVIIDSKKRDLSCFSGSYLITPNYKEFCDLVGFEISLNEIETAAKNICQKYKITNVLVTLGKDGMYLVKEQGKSLHIPSVAKEVFDVTGAGDTVVATIASAIASGLDIEQSIYLANKAAGIVVERLGTARIYKTDLKKVILGDVNKLTKLKPRKEIFEETAMLKLQGKKVGFTNGCFDILHPGHVKLIQEAKSQCDILVMGLNSDSSVKRLKGEDRPINDEMSRAIILASLAEIDYIVLFSEDTPLELIRSIIPDVLIKGSDYKVEEVVGADIVTQNGGRIYLVDLEAGKSTTKIIKKINAK
ncbi:MAG: D-glycero-beta-D-manno-heptose-7-phosphate kinase [Rickettsiales bacterium]|jgi:D-beta-D-heptose 7-phosphate kinase / D-beta-D-heptose 1-phosphate adenosyltransferase|nr:D-glycero-beta-D-manno-heptose-7-phosphate kinase [Rickettsiales bacterium]